MPISLNVAGIESKHPEDIGEMWKEANRKDATIRSAASFLRWTTNLFCRFNDSLMLRKTKTAIDLNKALIPSTSR